MRLELVIADESPSVLSEWAEVFREVEGVAFLDANFQTLCDRPALDAVLLMGRHAHERYGGRPTPGRSEVLNTKGEAGMPPWVVTKAPFVGHIERRTRPDGSSVDVIVTDHELTHEDEAYVVCVKAFERIKEFNRSAGDPGIRSLGLEIESVHSPYGEHRKEAEAVRKAYVECREV